MQNRSSARFWPVVFGLVGCIALLAVTPSVDAKQESVVKAGATAAEVSAFERWLGGPVSILLTHEEITLAQGLRSAEEIETFKRWFWARRNPTPSGRDNAFFKSFQARLDYVNKEFGVRSGRPGWSTTPGAIYLILGRPDEIHTRRRGVIAEGKFRDLELWVYRTPTDRLPLSIGLVEIGGTVRMVTEPSGVLPTALVEALDAASAGTVRHPDLPFGETRFIDNLADLPLRGTVRIVADEIAGDFSIRLDELYGTRDGDGIHFALRIQLFDARRAADKRQPIDSVELVFELDAEHLTRWSGRVVQILLRLPVHSPDAGPYVILTEEATGRQTRIEPTPLATASTNGYVVDAILAAVGFHNTDGSAVAFIEAADPPKAGSLWLDRATGEIDGEILPWLMGELRLVRLNTAQESSH